MEPCTGGALSSILIDDMIERNATSIWTYGLWTKPFDAEREQLVPAQQGIAPYFFSTLSLGIGPHFFFFCIFLLGSIQDTQKYLTIPYDFIY